MRAALRRIPFQARIFLSFAIVILLATTAGYLYINLAVNRAFSAFTVRSFTWQDQLATQIIVAYYERTGSFDGLVDLLESNPRGFPILLVDAERRVVFSPDERYIGRRLDESQLVGGQRIILASGETWTVVPYRAQPGRDELEAAFLSSIRRALWLAGLTAALAGLLLALYFLRQTTSPLRKLESATRRIAKGHLGERVAIESSDEIGRLGESFNDMARSLEDAERSKRQMIADISHELRTPLTAVRSALEGLRDGLVDPSQETFAALHNRILLFTRLVNDLHQLALADAGQLSIHRRTVRLEEIVEEIVETIGPQMEDAQIALISKLAPDLPPIQADAHRIQQVLLNLLANAIRHTPPHGSISVSATPTAEDEIEIRICDTGSGIPPGELDHVFDRFYRVGQAREASGGGAGLGLSIAKALVEAHGGRIRAENAPAGGACFEVVLPCHASRDEDPAQS